MRQLRIGLIRNPLSAFVACTKCRDNVNDFHLRMGISCAICKAIFSWFPVVFIAAIICWSYYAYVVQLCILHVYDIAAKVFFILFYHVVLVMFIWTYWKVIFQKHAPIPREYYISEEECEQYLRAINDTERNNALRERAGRLPISCFTCNGGYRFCEKCQCLKPDRAHHCSMCERCILKMDHHCPWVNNCVGFSTYKYFVLFLFYAELYCLFIVFTSLKYFIEFWTEGGFSSMDQGKFHILFVFFVAFMFAVSLTALLGYHIYLTMRNRSTLESFRPTMLRSGPEKNAFNLGRKQNFREVFGDSAHLWFFPLFTSRGDGSEFVLNFSCQGSISNYSAVGYSSAQQFDSVIAGTEDKPIVYEDVLQGGSADVD